MPLEQFISALQQPEAFPDAPAGAVDVIQTHISVLVFTDDRVYKVKKPLKLDFLDYSTLDKRKHYCEEEVRLNSRLAPGVYLGVAPITRGEHGALHVHGDGEPVEYAVEMVRLPADCMMSDVLDHGGIDNQRLNELVEILARFHRHCATGERVDEYARPDEIAAQVEENLAALDAHAKPGHALTDETGTITPTMQDHLVGAARRWLTDHRAMLEQRVRDGRVREGHGDLHAGNICLLPEGIVIYDCIEFSRRFRCRDVACELAFLAMDLDLRGFRGFAGYLLHQYAGATDDPDLPGVSAFYKMHLAAVRGKVASMRAQGESMPERERADARLEAMRYFHLAAAYTLTPALILMCGLPATGKSFAARAIARPFEAVVLRSDVVRKELAGLAPDRRTHRGIETGIYTPAFTERTYAALRDRAADHLRRGKTVIVDATFPTEEARSAFFDAARTLGVPCLLVEMTCPEHVIRQRMQARAKERHDVSDADWQVYEHAKARFEPTDHLAPESRCRLDSQRSAETMTGAVLDALMASHAAKPAAR